MNALTQMASKFRTQVGESLATVKTHDTPLAEATTPSLEALKAFTTAVKLYSSNGVAEALPHFQRAVEIDPQFADGPCMAGTGIRRPLAAGTGGGERQESLRIAQPRK